jgi:hypothetical protein
LVACLAWYLGVLGDFDCGLPASKVCKGFASVNWAILSLLLPFAAGITAWYLRLLNRSLISVCSIIRPLDSAEEILPVDGMELAFATYLQRRLGNSWLRQVVFPAAALTFLLVFIADGGDIVSPVHLASRSIEADWTNHGLMGAPHLVLNLLAFGMEAYVGYCVMMILLITIVSLSVVFIEGIGGKTLSDWIGASVTRKFKPVWQCTTRCGLESLDSLFVGFTVISSVALGAAAISIISKSARFNATDVGSWILAVIGLSFVPIAFFLVYFPYWTSFPSRLPDYCRREIADGNRPNKWPFGSDHLGISLLAFLGAVTVAVLTAAIDLLLQKHAG